MKALYMFRNLNIIKEVPCANSMISYVGFYGNLGEGNCGLCSVQVDRIWAEKVDSQFVLALDDLKEQRYWVLFLQCNGPPGTGKTKTISILLYSLLSMNCRTLACAPKNIAVAELALCILNLHKDSGCLLGDFLLFGTMNRLELCDELGKIYVDHRVDSLVECFAPLTGWKKHFVSMVDQSICNLMFSSNF
ncbi:hypothetical protein MKX01_021352 [Papaver californicum]|nr:hypothetical protein MKX01_021352 [Papaver californicum]